MSSLQEQILAKKAALAETVSDPLGKLAQQCAGAWAEPDRLDQVLADAITGIPHCVLLYAWDVNGIERSSMVRQEQIDLAWRGTDLSRRPYLTNNLPFKGIMLSSVYRSIYDQQQCITALQAVRQDEQLLGFIAADFPVNALLQDTQLRPQEMQWQQFRGDPAVRSTVFMQKRAPSLLEEHIDAVLEMFETLIREHGVFHCKIHFSSGRCSIWLIDDPYSYQIVSVDEIINPDFCLAYPLRPYPERARITPEQIHATFKQFKALRLADDTIYLRSASLNIMNGMLGLTFSCDGSHYMPVQDFLARDLDFWFGEGTG
ncbi:MAG: PDC sensor domain-containing protein [Gammaproteobacteria bacterium]|nr:PDC sensor domain-containing protein [Gammaproteobacteria bacterium]